MKQAGQDFHYYDGNGRTARLISTFILQRDGYDLNGFFSMEEHHARDLEKYYASLSVHRHHNYYEGRANADLTAWVLYFVTLLAHVFDQAKKEVQQLSKTAIHGEPEQLRMLDRRARVVLSLFANRELLTSRDIASVLGLSPRMVRILLQKWTQDGWLIIADPSNRGRAYSLSAIYRQSDDRR